MYVCVCVCVGARVHGCTHGCMHGCTHGCMEARMHACMHGCIDACMHACMDVFMMLIQKIQFGSDLNFLVNWFMVERESGEKIFNHEFYLTGNLTWTRWMRQRRGGQSRDSLQMNCGHGKMFCFYYKHYLNIDKCNKFS